MHSKNKSIYLSTKDYLVSGETFDLILDESLELLRTNPVPEKLSEYYNTDLYISHTDEKKGILNFLYHLVKKYSLRKKMNLIEKRSQKKGSLLDIGAGTGDFLIEAKKRGWTINGTEPNAIARNNAKSKGIVLSENLHELQGQFDVITLWHVLEHIRDLDKTILKISSLLRENGMLLIAVPNYKSYDAAYYGKYWAAFDVPRHLWHFSQKAIKEIFKSDFELEEVKPMIFDSFYVSLLSEKYKSGKNFTFKAFYIGWKSNAQARKTKEYSSLIYCLKRVKIEK